MVEDLPLGCGRLQIVLDEDDSISSFASGVPVVDSEEMSSSPPSTMNLFPNTSVSQVQAIPESSLENTRTSPDVLFQFLQTVLTLSKCSVKSNGPLFQGALVRVLIAMSKSLSPFTPALSLFFVLYFILSLFAILSFVFCLVLIGSIHYKPLMDPYKHFTWPKWVLIFMLTLVAEGLTLKWGLPSTFISPISLVGWGPASNWGSAATFIIWSTKDLVYLISIWSTKNAVNLLISVHNGPGLVHNGPGYLTITVVLVHKGPGYLNNYCLVHNGHVDRSSSARRPVRRPVR